MDDDFGAVWTLVATRQASQRASTTEAGPSIPVGISKKRRRGKKKKSRHALEEPDTGESDEKLVEGLEDLHSYLGARMEGVASGTQPDGPVAVAIVSTTRTEEDVVGEAETAVTNRADSLQVEVMHVVAMLADPTAFIRAGGEGEKGGKQD